MGGDNKVWYVPYFVEGEIVKEEPGEFFKHCVGAGWQNLLLGLSEKLFFLGWDGGVLQVKEKFGTLRFYFYDNIPGLAGEIAWDVVAQAEAQSGQICEECGEYGRLRRGGWIKTLCATHAKGREVEEA